MSLLGLSRRKVETYRDIVFSAWSHLSGGDADAQTFMRKAALNLFNRLDRDCNLLTRAEQLSTRSAAERWHWDLLFQENGIRAGLLHLAPGGSLPLHDHPDSIGVSIVLFGQACVTQADKDQPLTDAVQHLVELGDCSFVFPERGNLHGFSSDTGAVLLNLVIERKPQDIKQWHFSHNLLPSPALVRKSLVLPVALMAANTVMAGNCQIASIDQTNLETIQSCANDGDINSQLLLGNYYLKTESEYDAAEWYQKAAARGSSDAMYQLGLMYFDGIGVTDDPVKAMDLMYAAGSKGHKEAMQVWEYVMANPEPLEGVC
jgi:hypothetical protein